MKCRIFAIPIALVLMGVQLAAAAETLKGVVNQIDAETAVLSINLGGNTPVANAESGENIVNVFVPADAKVTLNGQEASISDVPSNALVDVQVNNTNSRLVATEVDARSTAVCNECDTGCNQCEGENQSRRRARAIDTLGVGGGGSGGSGTNTTTTNTLTETRTIETVKVVQDEVTNVISDKIVDVCGCIVDIIDISEDVDIDVINQLEIIKESLLDIALDIDAIVNSKEELVLNKKEALLNKLELVITKVNELPSDLKGNVEDLIVDLKSNVGPALVKVETTLENAEDLVAAKKVLVEDVVGDVEVAVVPLVEKVISLKAEALDNVDTKLGSLLAEVCDCLDTIIALKGDLTADATSKVLALKGEVLDLALDIEGIVHSKGELVQSKKQAVLNKLENVIAGIKGLPADLKGNVGDLIVDLKSNVGPALVKVETTLENAEDLVAAKKVLVEDVVGDVEVAVVPLVEKVTSLKAEALDNVDTKLGSLLAEVCDCLDTIIALKGDLTADATSKVLALKGEVLDLALDIEGIVRSKGELVQSKKQAVLNKLENVIAGIKGLPADLKGNVGDLIVDLKSNVGPALVKVETTLENAEDLVAAKKVLVEDVVGDVEVAVVPLVEKVTSLKAEALDNVDTKLGSLLAEVCDCLDTIIALKGDLTADATSKVLALKGEVLDLALDIEGIVRSKGELVQSKKQAVLNKLENVIAGIKGLPADLKGNVGDLIVDLKSNVGPALVKVETTLENAEDLVAAKKVLVEDVVGDVEVAVVPLVEKVTSLKAEALDNVDTKLGSLLAEVCDCLDTIIALKGDLTADATSKVLALKGEVLDLALDIEGIVHSKGELVQSKKQAVLNKLENVIAGIKGLPADLKGNATALVSDLKSHVAPALLEIDAQLDNTVDLTATKDVLIGNDDAIVMVTNKLDSTLNLAAENSGLTADGNLSDRADILLTGPLHEAFARSSINGIISGEVAPFEPPAALVETVLDVETEAGFEFVPGNWSWNATQEKFVWVSGVIRKTPVGKKWLAGSWTKVGDKFQRIPGVWVDADLEGDLELIALPEGPGGLVNLDTDLSKDQFLSPGQWVLDENGEPVWKDPKIAERVADYVWNPTQYLQAPEGLRVVKGFWDHKLDGRGTVFAPLQISADLIADGNVDLSPVVTLDPSQIFLHLFVDQETGQFLFGNQYELGAAAGIVSWVEANTTLGLTDPLFGQTAWEFANKGQNLTERLTGWLNYFNDHPEMRPVRSIRQLPGFVARNLNKRTLRHAITLADPGRFLSLNNVEDEITISLNAEALQGAATDGVELASAVEGVTEQPINLNAALTSDLVNNTAPMTLPGVTTDNLVNIPVNDGVLNLNGLNINSTTNLGLPTLGNGTGTLPNIGSGGTGLPNIGGSGSGLPNIGGGGSGLPNIGSGGSGLPNIGTGGSGLPNIGSGGSGLPNLGSGGSGGLPNINTGGGLPNINVGGGGLPTP